MWEGGRRKLTPLPDPGAPIYQELTRHQCTDLGAYVAFFATFSPRRYDSYCYLAIPVIPLGRSEKDIMCRASD